MAAKICPRSSLEKPSSATAVRWLPAINRQCGACSVPAVFGLGETKNLQGSKYLCVLTAFICCLYKTCTHAVCTVLRYNRNYHAIRYLTCKLNYRNTSSDAADQFLPFRWVFFLIKVFIPSEILSCLETAGHAVVQLVEALWHKPEGFGFDSRCCH